MIEREITPVLRRRFGEYPVVMVTGPRQSGKTTLCRHVFDELPYSNLESPIERQFATSDPLGYLAQFQEGGVLDEIHRAPELLSYIQVIVDEKGCNSLFVLTGSEQIGLSSVASQSLAGRVALIRLLPLSLSERLSASSSVATIDDVLFGGFYPRVVDNELNPLEAYNDYFATYVERDIARMDGVGGLAQFEIFVRLCAGRIGQLVNLSSLGADAGVSQPTARRWLSVLELMDIALQLRPYYKKIGKRLIKAPKLYFQDVGLASFLLGIENSKQIATHPLRGALFENAVVVEALKYRHNRGIRPNLSFFRDRSGLECDLLYTTGNGVALVEAKSGSSLASDSFHTLGRVEKILQGCIAKAVVYGGKARQSRTQGEVVPFWDFSEFLAATEHDEFSGKR